MPKKKSINQNVRSRYRCYRHCTVQDGNQLFWRTI